MQKNKKLDVFVGGAHHKDKYDSNKAHQFLINGFMKSVDSFVKKTGKTSFFEAGCGEGQILGVLYQQNLDVSGMDLSEEAVEMTITNFKNHYDYDIECFVGSVYDRNVLPHKCILCCEVLEHLDNPRKALENIVARTDEYFIVSVPREPLWCVLNFLRGKYWRSFGNTPGHINHWSKRAFVKLISEYAEVVDVKNPMPWTVVLAKVR